MGTSGCGFERPTDQALMELTREGVDGDDEDHMAGLVKQIAFAMLEEEDDDGKSFPNTAWKSCPTVQVTERIWSKSVDDCETPPGNLHDWDGREAMELLYMELVRLKMEELAMAQHQLSLYQKALVDSRYALYPGFTTTDYSAPEGQWLPDQRLLSLEVAQSLPRRRQAGGGEWTSSFSSQVHCDNQRVGPSIHSDGRYLVKGVPSTPRELGGTGVFLPRCRGARHLRSMEGRRKPDVQHPGATRCIKNVACSKRKDEVGRSTIYPPFAKLLEVSPEVSLPTEWTY